MSMNISKNQIWVLIGIVAIGVIALVSDIEVKVEVGAEDYADFDECYFKEIQNCNEGNQGASGNSCLNAAYEYCTVSLGFCQFPEDCEKKERAVK